ncbi:hemin ABC transporter substrate-binding protein [Alcanivorax sp. MD8A]|uniref:heme/hemin ABC transporter substrate-binding protein n=1 Tax=Alcanivorax sp. MD8A TaxID=1177157 RepID=UPI000C9A68F4|nr:ABC transporter substrate-binding protein [Alcanivorax sp. MD8A]
MRIVKMTGSLLAGLMLALQVQAAEPMRLISADAGATNMIVALGLADSLVAVDVTSPASGDLAELPRIGYHRNLSAEGLLSLSPTHLVGTDHMGPDTTLSVLEGAGIELIRLPAAYSLPALESNLKTMAEALGREAQAQSLLDRFAAQTAELQTHSLKGNKVAFILSARGGFRLAGAGSNAGQAMIDLLGADNVADFENYRTVSMESLLAMEPDVILVAGEMSGDPAAALLDSQPLLAHTPAGKRGHIYSVDGASLVAGLSLAALDEAERVANAVGNPDPSSH